MSTSKKQGITITTKPAFQAIGLHWEGTRESYQQVEAYIAE